MVEWSTDYGDGRIHRNVTVAELADGEAVVVTDCWGAPFDAPGWRRELTGSLEVPREGVRPAADALAQDRPPPTGGAPGRIRTTPGP
ncbi:hypothetical protein G4Z16_07695 [Streptomyces bathyalis]|uniref:Uncharacterized protein n=1 Tax=Streptomyces bathyalis TaxID=2710756 RepID=A0A7T1T4L6_9ACTN|nr:hypothetical protein [Streptomyces bathyalis]QPP06303.1 hypothetical protein G4Z16_07695 [Streptomyces bathyalis]